MFTNNISSAKSVFHQSMYPVKSGYSMDMGKFYGLIQGIEDRVTSAMLDSESRTSDLITNIMMYQVKNSSNIDIEPIVKSDAVDESSISEIKSSDLLINMQTPSALLNTPLRYNPIVKPIKLGNSVNDAKLSEKISQLDEPYATIVQLITDRISKSEKNIESAISNSDSNTQVGLFSVTQSIAQTNNLVINSNTQLNNVLTFSNSKIDFIKSNVVAISSSVSEISNTFNNLLSNTISQINAAISKSESNVLKVISDNLTDEMNSTMDISGSDISGVTIHNCHIMNCQLINCDISNCDISGGTGTGTGTIESKLIHEMVISNCVTTIINYYSNFALGKFEQVRGSLTTDVFETLSKELYLLKRSFSDTSDYEIIRNIIVKSFESLMQMIYQYLNYTEIVTKFEAASGKAAILDDMQALEEYIKKLSESANISVLPEVSFTAPLFTVKPEIQRYIDLYGFPEGGVFDVDKLGALV
jgi:hypothetical protein